MEKGRVFVTTVMTDNMCELLKPIKAVVTVEAVAEGVDCLKDINFISALKDEALVKALKERGIDIELNPIKVKLLPGDTVYVINPGVRLYDLGDKDQKKSTSMAVAKYCIYNQSEYIKTCLDAALNR